MLTDRRQRRWLSLWLVVMLLFAQMATAAHACSRSAAAVEAGAGMAAMPGCPGHPAEAQDVDGSLLCKAHCERGASSVNAGPAVADVSPAPLLLAVLDWSVPTLAPAPDRRRLALTLSGAPPPGAPPLYLSLLVLRC